jgi:TrmH family RNA methyltransferase
MPNSWKNLSEEQRRDKFVEKFSSISYPAGKSHPAVKQARELVKKSNRIDNNSFEVLIEGYPILAMAYKYNVKIKYLFVCPEEIYSQDILTDLPRFINSAETVLDVSPKVFDLITNKGNSNGLLAIGELHDGSISSLGKQDLVVVLDGLETPGNIGSIIRSADAVDAKAIIITNKQAHLFHPLMIRSSRGACFKIPIIEEEARVVQSYLLDNNYEIVLADPHAEKYYYEQSYKNHTALIMGSERFGISPQWFEKEHLPVSIPMMGDCDSLNVSIATTVLLYDVRLKKNQMI